jgi:hypothetical protein
VGLAALAEFDQARILIKKILQKTFEKKEGGHAPPTIVRL